MDSLITHFYELFTVSGALALLNISLIDIVMSGDNAILIGMATRKLQGKERKKAIFFGILLATILRIIFASFAVFLLSIVGIKLAGGILLLYVVWKFYRELRTQEHAEHKADIKKAGLWAAIWTIIIADVSMSLDNVLAVAGAAHENIVALGVGLVFSIVLMAFASNLIAVYLDRYPQIQWVGLFVILFVAVEMILTGSAEVDHHWLHMDVLPFLIFILGGLFIFLHAKYIRPADEKKLRDYLHDHTLSFLTAGVIFLMGMLFFGEVVSKFVKSHEALFFSLLFILFFCLLELTALARVGKNTKE